MKPAVGVEHDCFTELVMYMKIGSFLKRRERMHEWAICLKQLQKNIPYDRFLFEGRLIGLPDSRYVYSWQGI